MARKSFTLVNVGPVTTESPKGSQMIVEIKVRSHEMSERILAGLDVEARHKLVEMLSLVKRNLQALKSSHVNVD